MDRIIPEWAAPPDVAAMTTLRRGGASCAPYDAGGDGGLNLADHVGDRPENILVNRALLRPLLPAEPVWLSQVHGVVVVDAAKIAGPVEADASFTTQAGVVCAILTADCLPVLFCDVSGTVVGAAHAGWRGLATGILGNTVVSMREAGAGEIVAWLGPAIGPQRFEVGGDVLDAFIRTHADATVAFKSIEGRPGKYLADVYRLARMILAKAGVEQVAGGGLCTMSDASRFYSYRRDRVTGRMASLIWLR
jgi:YfiH family protein